MMDALMQHLLILLRESLFEVPHRGQYQWVARRRWDGGRERAGGRDHHHDLPPPPPPPPSTNTLITHELHSNACVNAVIYIITQELHENT